MKKVIFVSRCAWTLYNFRKDFMLYFLTKGYKVYALGGKEGDYGEKLKKLDIEYIEIPVSKGFSLFGDLRLLFFLILLYKKLEPDIILHYTIKPIIYGTLAAAFVKFEGVYNFITGLGYLFMRKKSFFKTIGEFLYKISLSFSRKVFFYNSSDLLYFISHNIVFSLISRIVPGSGINMKIFEGPKISNSESIKVAMVSRFLIEKGVREFVEMAKNIKNIMNRVDFIMIGGPDERNPSTVREKEIKTWQNQGIIVKDRIDNVPDFLRSIDILVHPTYYKEGIPRILREGSASALPVVTTDIPGCREVVSNGYTGFLVPPKDINNLTKKTLILLLNPSFRKKMGKRGKKSIKVRFSNRKVFRVILNYLF